MEPIKILLVDDEPDILEIIEYNLQKQGYIVLTENDGKKAIETAKLHTPHLIILDVMMPVLNGVETCEQLRKIDSLKDTLIVFLSARGEDFSLLAGFEAGADDYITKPITPKLLLSKIKAILRRSAMINKVEVKMLEFGRMVIDLDEYKVLLNKKEIILPRKEFELLALLASEPKKVFKRDDILEKVWGYDVIVGGRTIDVHIRKLREKLGDEYFETIKGVGYKFVP